MKTHIYILWENKKLVKRTITSYDHPYTILKEKEKTKKETIYENHIILRKPIKHLYIYIHIYIYIYIYIENEKQEHIW